MMRLLLFRRSEILVVQISVSRLEEYLRKGGTAIFTTGFLKAAYDRGIQDMTSAQISRNPK